MATFLKNIFFLFTFCNIIKALNSQSVQEYSAYDNLLCSPTVPFGSYGRYVINLESYFENDNLAVAASGVGNWIFYDYANYTGDSELVVLRRSSGCTILQTLGSRVSSMRFAGDPSDYKTPSITIYEGTNFRGREAYITDDTPKVLFDGDLGWDGGWRDIFGSYIITGDSSSCWTLYYAVRYTDISSVCVCGQDSDDFTPVFVPNNPFPPYNSIGSVKKGCGHTTTVMSMPPGYDAVGRRIQV